MLVYVGQGWHRKRCWINTKPARKYSYHSASLQKHITQQLWMTQCSVMLTVWSSGGQRSTWSFIWRLQGAQKKRCVLWWPQPVREVILALFHNVSVRWKGRVNLNQTLNWADPREMSFAELVHFLTKQTPFLFLFHLLSSGLCCVTVHSERAKLNTYRLREMKRSLWFVSLAQILQKMYSLKRFYTQIKRNFNIQWIENTHRRIWVSQLDVWATKFQPLLFYQLIYFLWTW